MIIRDTLSILGDEGTVSGGCHEESTNKWKDARVYRNQAVFARFGFTTASQSPIL